IDAGLIPSNDDRLTFFRHSRRRFLSPKTERSRRRERSREWRGRPASLGRYCWWTPSGYSRNEPFVKRSSQSKLVVAPVRPASALPSLPYDCPPYCCAAVPLAQPWSANMWYWLPHPSLPGKVLT